MANITLSIPDDVHKQMKHYSEIRWSEVARKAIVEKIEMIQHAERSQRVDNSLVTIGGGDAEVQSRVFQMRQRFGQSRHRGCLHGATQIKDLVQPPANAVDLTGPSQLCGPLLGDLPVVAGGEQAAADEALRIRLEAVAGQQRFGQLLVAGGELGRGIAVNR